MSHPPLKVSRETYLQALENLCASSTTPLSAESLASVAPHLMANEIQGILDGVARGGALFFATPPLRVRDSIQVVRVYTDEGSKEAHLSYFAGRVGEDPSRHMYAERAIDYARRNWRDQLDRDRSIDFMSIPLDDPKELMLVPGSWSQPATKMVLSFTLSRRLDVIRAAKNAPQSGLINECILEITHSPVISRELKGEHCGYTRCNCWRCGSGLEVQGCSGCEIPIENFANRLGWTTPLPRKLVEYVLSIGHKFETDPAIAWARERRHWEEAKRLR